MSTEERNIWSALAASLIVNAWFLNRIRIMLQDGTAEAPNALQLWAQTVIWVVPVAIVAAIGLNILTGIVHGMITGERGVFLKDERDRKFQLWGLGATLAVMVIGFPLSLGALALGHSGFLAFNLIYLTFFLADIAGNVLKLALYRADR